MSAKAQEIHRSGYLRSKGLSPRDEHQLSIVFPDQIQRQDLRHIPNDYGRSSLFTARNKRFERRVLQREVLYHYNEAVSITYTGIELRAEDDELIWLQILAYGRDTPLGKPFYFSIRDLVRDVGWSKNGHYYKKARECISRLKANEILALNSKAYGVSHGMSLIASYATKNDNEGNALLYEVTLSPHLIYLFAGNTFTSHKWLTYRKLSPVARRLADYIESHKQPYPLALERFKGMCGSADGSAASWRQTAAKACREIQEAEIIKVCYVEKSSIVCARG